MVGSEIRKQIEHDKKHAIIRRKVGDERKVKNEGSGVVTKRIYSEERNMWNKYRRDSCGPASCG